MPTNSKGSASAGTIHSILGVLREVDVRPVRAAAEAPFVLAFFSQDLALAQHLTDLLYRGLRQHDIPPMRVCAAFPLGAPAQPTRIDIAVIVTRDDRDNSAELKLQHEFERARVPTLVCLIADAASPPPPRHQWLPASVTVLAAATPDGVIDDADATRHLVTAIRGLRAVDELSLARHLPAFRESVSRGLIEDTAIANAVYSFGSGILEINPVAGVPLNVADIVVLTKNQALMAYKVALAMGLNADFRQVMPQLAAVVGSGFLLRQTARSLIGLVPGFGLIPKVAVAFAGTYATGEMIYRWCAYGERVSGRALKDTYAAALARGKTIAQTLFQRRKNVATDKMGLITIARKQVHKEAAMLQVGDQIPDFALASDTAGEVRSSDLRGRRFVLYFYPKDDTSGCTAEACSFRDNLPDFSALDVPVYGVSPDTVTAHGKFRNKYGLTFPLLADPDHKVAEAFGTWVEKSMYGRKYMGIQRSTFVVGPDGRIEHVWEKVTPANHAKEVLAYLKGSPADAPQSKTATRKTTPRKAART